MVQLSRLPDREPSREDLQEILVIAAKFVDLTGRRGRREFANLPENERDAYRESHIIGSMGLLQSRLLPNGVTFNGNQANAGDLNLRGWPRIINRGIGRLAVAFLGVLVDWQFCWVDRRPISWRTPHGMACGVVTGDRPFLPELVVSPPFTLSKPRHRQLRRATEDLIDLTWLERPRSRRPELGPAEGPPPISEFGDVQLYDREPWATVFGRAKFNLTEGELAVVRALILAGSAGLSLKKLKANSGVASAPRTIRLLKNSDPDWHAVLDMAGGRGHGGYRIISGADEPE